MDYAATVNYLYGLQKHGIKLGLDNTVKLLSALGNPQNHFSSIHVAGTNGKGSTSAMMASILQTNGLKVGLFTSPHLVSFTERIRVNNEEITEREVVELAEEIRNMIHDSGCRIQDNKNVNRESRIVHHEFNPTFFEVVTAMGFLYFKRKNIDWAVVETGMGGRLDATNVLRPEVSVITNINYDHKDFLGNTITEIAGEKAGIIKDGIPVVTSLQEPSAMEVIKKKAGEKGARLFVYGKDFSSSIKTETVDGSVFDYEGDINFEDLFVPLSGRHQVLNAALAIKAIELASGEIASFTHESVRAGLESIKWQGRLELISENPEILIDGAHNPSASAVLAEALEKNFLPRYGRLILVLGIMADKDIEGIMRPLLPLASEIILTAPAYERAAPPQRLAEIAAGMEFRNTYIAFSVREAIKMAIKFSESLSGESVSRKNQPAHSPIHRFTHSLILIAGSFYTIGEAKEIICGKGVLSGLREKL